MRHLSWILIAAPWLALASAAGPQPDTPPHGPRSPKEELGTFHLPKGFHAELVACEPAIIDPVAMAFDEDGRLYVAEMIGYPNGGRADGRVTSGRIVRLEDRDGDGFFEKWTVFADGLRFPASAMPWKGGVLVPDAPNILYLKDTDGDGKADLRRELYTGFDLSNSEQIINALQWGLDNWVYGCAGGAGGTIRSVEKPDKPPVALHGRGVRFHPEQPGSLDPTSGGGQYGLAADDWEQWFTATNNQHLRQIILPDHYLRRNPYLAVGAVTLDIPDHGAACKVYRLSAFEAWRVERTRRRAGGPEARNFPSTELVPGGYVTSGCSPVVYTADRFPEAYCGNTFVCDPANNLIHRDMLVPNGATFIARRAEPDHEFLASTDNWFRPTSLTVGPDGDLYVTDFYREVIETPLSLPDDIKAKVNIESRGRGRIWRIVPDGPRSKRKPSLSKASVAELVAHLDDPNSWWRLTCQRLLVERQDRAAVQPLTRLAREAKSALGRAHALWALHGLRALDDTLIEAGLRDPAAGVREQALRLADERLASSEGLRVAVVALADDPSPRVRFQLAFTLGQADTPETTAALAKVARRDLADPWTQTAVLSSAGRCAAALLENLAHDREFTAHATGTSLQLLARLAALVGARQDDAQLAQVLRLLGEDPGGASGWQVAVLTGLGQGLQNTPRPLGRILEQPPPALRQAVRHVEPFFRRAATVARDEGRPVEDRLAAVRLLAGGPFATAGPALRELLEPRNASAVQLAAVRALSAHDRPQVADALLAGWASYSPAIRREVLEALFARTDRLARLLDALENHRVLAGQLEPLRLEQLRRHRDPRIRQRARALGAGSVAPERRQVLEQFRSVLQLKGDPARGKQVFKKTCATCHRLENEGVEVGPDLLSALRNKTPETLLVDILDPSREVDPRYLNYVVIDKSDRVFTGMIAAETASSLTLRRAEKAEDTILRNQIVEVQATAKSVMPEGLEMQLSRQELADVIAYLRSVR
jgi:putative membrane-bound dehydrogenase-like protein